MEGKVFTLHMILHLLLTLLSAHNYGLFTKFVASIEMLSPSPITHVFHITVCTALSDSSDVHEGEVKE